jgi:hypothetical protein
MNNEYLDPDSLPSPLNIRDCSTIQLSSAYNICPSSSPIKNIILEITKQIIDSIQGLELSDRDLCELVLDERVLYQINYLQHSSIKFAMIPFLISERWSVSLR